MSEIINLVNKDTAERISANRDSKTKHIDIHLLRGRRIVIEGCEDHKYCYWLSKQRLDDIETNADILSVIMYDRNYDYITHAYRLYDKLGPGCSDICGNSLTVKIERVNDIEGIGYRAPWGTDSLIKTPAENGLFMAEELVKYYNGLLAQCKNLEQSAELMEVFDSADKSLLGLSGDVSRDYPKARKLLDSLWKWKVIRLSGDEKLRFRYERLLSELERIYNQYMTGVH